MTTPWYYESHTKGAFPCQQKLCEAVQWTKYNLEGQRLKSPTVLSAIQGNPLTIRLLGLDEGLKHFNKVKRIAGKIEKLSRKQFYNKEFSPMSITWIAESSLLNTDGAPIIRIEIAGEDFELRYIDIQLALYKFFTNFGSVIDRLAYEIDSLHELGIPRRNLDWQKLTSKSELCKLRKKNKELANLLYKYRKRFSSAVRYRNRLIHDGIIYFEVEHILRKFLIYMREKPDDNTSECNINSITFCEDIKKKVLALLDESYRLMLEYIEKAKEALNATGENRGYRRDGAV